MWIILLFCASVAAQEVNTECSDIGLSPYFADLNTNGWTVEKSDKLFCSDSAPASVRCRCNYVLKCETRLDPMGTDIGECVCCSEWVNGVLAITFLVAGMLFLALVYIACCKGKLWCDGHRAPVLPTRPRVMAPVMIPSNLPLPPNVFRGYSSTDFHTVVPPILPQNRTGDMQVMNTET